MSMGNRIAIAIAASAGLALGAVGATSAVPGRVGGAQEPRPRATQEATPRALAAREIAAMLRQGDEVDVDRVVSSLPGLGELAERRRQIAEELMEFALVKFVEPPSPSGQRGTFYAAIEDYIAWSSRRLDAALDLAESDDDRRRAMALEVAKIRRLEAIVRDMTRDDAVGVTPQNRLELEFRRLDLETRLSRFVGGEAG